jgi:hypothetical protein
MTAELRIKTAHQGIPTKEFAVIMTSLVAVIKGYKGLKKKGT